jgi:hypothetical protein
VRLIEQERAVLTEWAIREDQKKTDACLRLLEAEVPVSD